VGVFGLQLQAKNTLTANYLKDVKFMCRLEMSMLK